MAKLYISIDLSYCLLSKNLFPSDFKHEALLSLGNQLSINLISNTLDLKFDVLTK